MTNTSLASLDALAHGAVAGRGDGAHCRLAAGRRAG